MAKSIDEVIESQGWTSDTVLELLWTFLRERKLLPAVRDFLAVVADEERKQKP